jgi:hypothetical protein
MIHAFGDSFVVGDQDDFIGDKNTNLDHPPTHGMNEPDRVHYLKYNVSFPALIAKNLNVTCKNHAVRGTGNYPQLDLLYTQLNHGKINPGDIVMFGLATAIRDRIGLLDYRQPDSLSVLHIGNWTNMDNVKGADQFYVLSALCQLASIFSVKIIKFNIFDNSINKSTLFSDYVGNGLPGTTLIDILNNTWLKNTQHPYHTKITIPQEYKELYTHNCHPSILGHQKIADWFLKNIFNE